MKTGDFLRKHNACWDGARWALSISDDMSVVWDAMNKEGKHDWLIWTATRPGVFSESILRKLACRFVRETPLADGRMVWDLLTDDRSRKAVQVAEAYVDGNATKKELVATAAAFDVAAVDAAAWAAEAAAWAANATAAAEAAHDAYLAARAASSAAAACAAADAASADAAYAARAAAWAARAAYYAAYSAYSAAAESAQIKMIAELGNPFNKEA